MHARGAQTLQVHQLSLFVAHQHRLGDFQHQFISWHAGFLKFSQPLVGRFLVIKLARRAVDGDGQIQAFFRQRLIITHHLCQHKLTQGDNRAGLFGNWNKLTGRNFAALGMLPADQRLTSGHQTRIGGNDRLILDVELLFFERVNHLMVQRNVLFGTAA
nr:hypothetical protein [Pseudidiomarina insulisalsae]